MKLSVRDQLIKLVQSTLIPEDKYVDYLVNIVHQEYKGDMLKLFLKINERDKKKIEEHNQILYRGVESGMHSFTALARALTENKTSHKAKAFLKMVLNDGNFAYMIDICKAYFPKGQSDGHSINGKWFFAEFVRMVKENREQYVKGGDSFDWAENFDHIDYINLIIEKHT